MSAEAEGENTFRQGPVVVFHWRNLPNWPVARVSPNVSEVLGYRAEDFLSGEVRYAACVHPDDLPRVVDEVQAAIQSGVARFRHEPYRLIRADGGVITVWDFTTVVRDPGGETTGFVGYVIDVTDRIEAEAENRRLQRQLLEAQRLESLGVLAGGIAHDFNNLLTGILGHAGRLRGGGGDPEEAADRIERLALRAADLCRQLLVYSGRAEVRPAPISVGSLLRDLVGVLQVTLPEGARLSLEVAEPLPLVLGDAAQLQQVVLNLLTNAAEALGERGRSVRVSAEARAWSASALADFESGPISEGEYVTLVVEDDGAGMEESVRQRIFEPFFSTKFTGRGLGLAAVLGVVRGHRGAIQVRSIPGAGTSVTVLLPAHTVRIDGETPVSPGATTSGRVLVVDDEPAIRELAVDALASVGISVRAAADGVEALEAIEAELPDVIVLDVLMPRLDGRGVLRAMEERGLRIPVVLTSGYAGAAEGAGAELVAERLAKPYRVQELRAAVQRALLRPG